MPKPKAKITATAKHTPLFKHASLAAHLEETKQQLIDFSKTKSQLTTKDIAEQTAHVANEQLKSNTRDRAKQSHVGQFQNMLNKFLEDKDLLVALAILYGAEASNKRAALRNELAAIEENSDIKFDLYYSQNTAINSDNFDVEQRRLSTQASLKNVLQGLNAPTGAASPFSAEKIKSANERFPIFNQIKHDISYYDAVKKEYHGKLQASAEKITQQKNQRVRAVRNNKHLKRLQGTCNVLTTGAIIGTAVGFLLILKMPLLGIIGGVSLAAAAVLQATAWVAGTVANHYAETATKLKKQLSSLEQDKQAIHSEYFAPEKIAGYSPKGSETVDSALPVPHIATTAAQAPAKPQSPRTLPPEQTVAALLARAAANRANQRGQLHSISTAPAGADAATISDSLVDAPTQQDTANPTGFISNSRYSSFASLAAAEQGAAVYNYGNTVDGVYSEPSTDEDRQALMMEFS